MTAMAVTKFRDDTSYSMLLILTMSNYSAVTNIDGGFQVRSYDQDSTTMFLQILTTIRILLFVIRAVMMSMAVINEIYMDVSIY
eukprot:scaffold464070_cov33-Prasinocladus_malaysianus.AAC.1